MNTHKHTPIYTLFAIMFLGLVFNSLGDLSHQSEQKHELVLIAKLGTAKMQVSAYCSCIKCCGRFSDKITASGHEVQPNDRFVAAPPEIPFNSLVIVPGYNNNQPVPVLDRGGLIKENRLDVYFDTHQEALNWGVRNIPVTFIQGE